MASMFSRYVVRNGIYKFRCSAVSVEDAMSLARQKGMLGELTVRKCPEVKQIPRVYNDGGLQGSSVGTKRKDCTVRALAIALDIEYAFAHRLLNLYGRQSGKGFHFHYWATHGVGKHLLDDVAIRPWNSNRRYCTVGTFLKQHPKGKFLCCIPGHVFAVVDGVAHDTWTPGTKTRIECAWVPVSR